MTKRGLGDQLDRRRPGGRQLGNTAIKRREASAPTHGERKKVSVRTYEETFPVFQVREGSPPI
jgi:hypothetical protein